MKALLLASVVALGWAGVASAAPVIGQISYSGYVAPYGGSNSIGMATGLDFVSNVTGGYSPDSPGGLTNYGAGSGSFAGFTCGNANGQCGFIRDIPNFAANTSIFAQTIFATGTSTSISFELRNIVDVTRSQDRTGGTITLSALGVIHFTGLDDTNGTFILMAQGNGITSYSVDLTALASTPVPVSEPSSLALLGLGVAGIAAMRRRVA